METIDYPIVEYVVGLCFVILSVGTTVFFRILAKKYDLKDYMPIFDQYVDEGISWAKKKVLEQYEDVNIDATEFTKSDFINNAVKYVLKNAPETLKKLGVNEDSVRDKVEAMVIQSYGYEVEEAIKLKLSAKKLEE